MLLQLIFLSFFFLPLISVAKWDTALPLLLRDDKDNGLLVFAAAKPPLLPALNLAFQSFIAAFFFNLRKGWPLGDCGIV